MLFGTIKKNNGELPQYYIENNHTPIVSQEMFLLVQEEIARRKSKSPASQKKSEQIGDAIPASMRFRNAWYVGSVAVITGGSLGTSVEKENRLAMHQPVGVRKEVLQVVTEHIGRCAAQCDSESNPGVGSATKGADSKCLHDTILQCATGGLDISLTTLKNQLEQKTGILTGFGDGVYRWGGERICGSEDKPT